MSIAHPIGRAWISTGGTGAQNYDEFADDAEITAIIADNPDSALAVEMPQRAPESVGRSFLEALPDAPIRLARAKAAGRYAGHHEVVALYRISGLEGTGYGLWAMVDTDEISTSADQPGLVIRNEDVFLEKVSERVALARELGHLLSPVLLLQTGQGNALHAALRAACTEAGPPDVTDLDPAGRRHEIWTLPAGGAQRQLLELAGAGELVVADGNHRSLAAQTAGLPRFLAVITTPSSVDIQPYNRLISELTVPVPELIARLRAVGGTVTPIDHPGIPAQRGTVQIYAADRAYLVTLPTDPTAPDVDNLDHALVERLLLRHALSLDPGDKRITYVGGDYPARWLVSEVNAGRSELAVLIAPVRVADFVAVNLARQKLPRKSTWFTPKARAGLVVAELSTGK
jgi:uncharacterized protein (DUF1015 family)